LQDRVDAPFIFLLGIQERFYREKDMKNYIKDGTYIINLDDNKIS